MSDLESKLVTPEPQKDGVTRAYLKRHLAFKGYIVKESDDDGPVKVLVNSMSLQEWERDSFEVQKSGRGKGRVKDYLMRLVGSSEWKHD